MSQKTRHREVPRRHLIDIPSKSLGINQVYRPICIGLFNVLRSRLDPGLHLVVLARLHP